MIPASDTLPAIERATLHLYQIYDVSDSIDLEHARTSLAAPTARVRPVVSRGSRIEIAELPLEISMGHSALSLGGVALTGRMNARIYDLGILAFHLIIPLPSPLDWEQAIEIMGDAQNYSAPVADAFIASLEALRKTLEPAIERPNETIRAEDYAILLIEQLGAGTPAAQLARHPTLLRVALGERRPLSAAATSLASTLSYYEDDLILLTWSAAIVIEPEAIAREDAALLLEFANVQLLAFRSYDAEVEHELARITPRIARSRRPTRSIPGSSGGFLREIHTLIADITDTSGRVENALKVTEDVYWNRVYAAAVNVLRIDVWRTGIAETLTVLRQTAALLHDEAQATLTTLLEVLVVVLIAVELVVLVLGVH